MKESIILITGSTDGIGFEAALKLAKLGALLIIHGRNQRKSEATVLKIKEILQSDNVSSVSGDLSSIEDIKTMSNELHYKFDRLDVLINNAGVYRPERRVTQFGLEETFTVNYIAPFLLTNLSIDLLKNSKAGRVVNVVSQVHSNQLDFKNLKYETGYSGVKAYSRSKTCLIMFTYLLAEKLKETNITVNCLHPGVINTKLLDAAMGMVGAPVLIGAENVIYVATSPELEKISGKYFHNKTIKPSKDITYNVEIQKRLWKKTEEILGMEFKINEI